jgi:hypothetical protein
MATCTFRWTNSRILKSTLSWPRISTPKIQNLYYGIGRIDLKECGSASIPEGRKLGNLPSKNPDQKKACDELHDKNMPFIKEGIDGLDKAIKLRPDYRYAIQLMSQLYLEKAAADCDDPIARTKDLRNWAAWNDKKDFGVSVEARLNSSGDFFEKQLFAVVSLPVQSSAGLESLMTSPKRTKFTLQLSPLLIPIRKRTCGSSVSTPCRSVRARQM